MTKLQEYLDMHLDDLVNSDEQNNMFFLFGKEIKKTRLRKGIKQIELAKKTGLTQACLSEIENGKYNPSIKQIVKIANGLECKINFKLEDK